MRVDVQTMRGVDKNSNTSSSFPILMDMLKISELISDVSNKLTIPMNSTPAIFLSAVGGYVVYILVYGLFFCPTRHIPGQLITRFTGRYFHYLLLGGSISTIIIELHKKYGAAT